MSEQQGGSTIIIKKIKKGGHGHHGGAWKVAYADFVTAMMAFFLLLWLLSSVPSQKLKGLSEYFTPTVGLKDQMGIGFDGGEASDTEGNAKKTGQEAIVYGAPSKGAIVKLPDSANQDKIDEKNFTAIKNDLYKAVHENPELKEFKENILIDQTPEGLRIQILDDEKRPLFIPGTSVLQPYTKDILRVISKFIKYLPNYISINGHTNSLPFKSEGIVDNWELSSSRANSARRFLIEGLIDPEQIGRIVGKGDQEPIDVENPGSVRNMRISLIILRNLIVPYQKQSAPEALIKR
jgi:chemotaxis protein MotB